MDAQELAQYKSGCHTRAEGISLTTMDSLDLPTTPERFKAQILLAKQCNRVWTMGSDLRVPMLGRTGRMRKCKQ